MFKKSKSLKIHTVISVCARVSKRDNVGNCYFSARVHLYGRYEGCLKMTPQWGSKENFILQRVSDELRKAGVLQKLGIDDGYSLSTGTRHMEKGVVVRHDILYDCKNKDVNAFCD